jgi:putative transposase
MCGWLEVSKSGYYHWRNRPDSATRERREDLKNRITMIFTASRETYGYRRVHAELGRRGVPCGLELVRHLMRCPGPAGMPAQALADHDDRRSRRGAGH